MLYVLNYADGEPYESFRKVNSWTAKHIGKADRIIEYKKDDIDQNFVDANSAIFAYKRGAGLWLWKPYLIHKALLSINDGDWLMYLDSGTTVINDIHKIVSFTEQQGQEIFLMEQPLLSRQFTKRECYVKMGIEDNGENQVLGLLLLLRKSRTSLEFVKEWLEICEDEELLSPNKFYKNIKEFEDFYAHREDQSLLNLLRIKYKMPVYRDCSDYGEMPYMYACSKYKYNPHIYENCKYPTTILCNRKVHPLIYLMKYYIKRLLRGLGFYYTEGKELKKRLK